MMGYPRADGRKGIRNAVAVVYLVECAHFVASEIALRFRGRDVQVIGFTGCYPNLYAHGVLERLCTHPNVGAVLFVSLGCEGFDRHRPREVVTASGRPTETVVIQASGG
ncbi:MAG TPA: UxaA family hydrolase, partial [Bauldia sp.]|nr:UxaA family hydrolase [Bauldia sp.]